MIQAVLPDEATDTGAVTNVFLVRYGTVPEVARFVATSLLPQRGDTVVVETHRGLQVGTVLEKLKPSTAVKADEIDFRVIRVATSEDVISARQKARDSEAAFDAWCTRIAQWKLNLELVDIEQTLDGQKLILYVLCDRGPDSTKLALQAAATGLGLIEVQPISATGLVQVEGKSCGSGGGCGCSH